VEGAAPEQDQRFAEWYVWAKREVSTDGRVCLGAAQAAVEALDGGGGDDAARLAARRSIAGHGIALVSRIPPRRRAYAEWYDWARREIGGDRARLHAAAGAALDRLDQGGDAAQAADAARGSVHSAAAPAPPPPPPQGQAPAPTTSYGPPTLSPTVVSFPPAAPAPAAPAPVQPAPAAAPVIGPPPAYAAMPPPPYPAHPAYAIPPPPPPPAPPHAYAGFLRRMAAWLIDTVLLTIGLVVVTLFVGIFAFIGVLSSGQDPSSVGLNVGIELGLLVIAFVLAWLYYAGLESSAWRGTIGKRLIRLVVTDQYGRRITFGRATGRYFGKIVSALTVLVGYFMVIFTERRQGLHDLMAGTLVVRQEHLSLIASPAPKPPPQSRPAGAGAQQA
jgi:uncharacterized RDD family membrane protein YckC